MIESISAITLATHNMRRAVGFYRLLDLNLLYGGEEAVFTSFAVGDNFLNLIAQPEEGRWSWWGRLIFYHSDLDALHARLAGAGISEVVVARLDAQPHACCRAVQIAGDDVPAGAPARQVIQRRQPAGQRVGRLV